ncbi:MAG TPA: hypothetical protein VIY72_12990 [Acidimicrobiales bacterium]
MLRRSPSTIAVAAAALGALTAAALASRRLRTWGATAQEAAELLPGDELIPAPADTTTRAIEIAAPAPTVWRWLVQIGTDRGGWYSYDRLERLLGVPVHNTGEIRDEWQHLAVGDRVCLAPEGWMGVPGGMILPVARLVEGRTIVLRQSPPTSPWDGVWSFHVRACSPDRSRLLIRSRTARPSGGARVAATISEPLAGLVTFAMERAMLRGIRDRAETVGPGATSSADGVFVPYR